MLNKVVLMGRLTRAPECKYVGERKVANFTLAVERARKNADGTRETDFIDCAAWGSSAEFVQKWFLKGAMAIVVGRLQTSHWQDKNGNKRVSVGVQVEEISFGETKKARQSAGTSPSYPAVDPAQYSAADFAEMQDEGDVPF
nr:single-stranded DNA-binding protein [uncultured Butyricicoccus sp.]